MNIGGLGLLFLVVAGAVAGMYAIAAIVSMLPPVDGWGNTVINSTNLTQANVSATAQVVPTTAVFLTLIIAGVILASIFLFVVYGIGKRRL